MELLVRLSGLWFLICSAGTSADANGPKVKVIVEEDSDVMLTCSISTKDNIISKRFNWMKDGQKKVFLYDAGLHSNKDLPGQDVQFKGRVSHFEDELKSGNASILIRNTKVADSGDYTCGFPDLPPSGRISHVQLVVEPKVKVKVEEHSDVMLPCSVSTNITSKLFDWMKDGQKEVFLYDAGLHSNNSRQGQDEQFKGRVSHFEDELKSGNASILIRNTTVADSGVYTCVFPYLQPSGQILYIQLVVGGNLKDRSGENRDAAPKPSVTMLDQTNTWALLQCEVLGASLKPEVEWQDSAGNILHAEEPQVSERGGRYNIILQTTVNKTDHYHCVVTQKEISHQTRAQTFVYISGTSSTGRIVAVSVLICLLVGGVVGFLVNRYMKQQSQKRRLIEELTGTSLTTQSEKLKMEEMQTL